MTPEAEGVIDRCFELCLRGFISLPTCSVRLRAPILFNYGYTYLDSSIRHILRIKIMDCIENIEIFVSEALWSLRLNLHLSIFIGSFDFSD